MSIRPTRFNADNIEIYHDECGLKGRTNFDAITHPKDIQGNDNLDFIYLECACGSVSMHPISGGADPENIQRLFMVHAARNPQRYEITTRRILDKNIAIPIEVKTKIKERTERLDFVGRFKHDLADAADLLRDDDTRESRG